MPTPPYINCCDNAKLDRVRTLYQSNHDVEALLRCATCASFWFYRFHEYTNWSGGDDDLTRWHSPLTAIEGERLRDTNDPTKEDLSFLRERPSWMGDDRGVRWVNGAPDHPFS
ncbi:MAG: hypothetical protein HOQ05_12305 [Corynebacteriales bacterium]|nr:hypothetical protein [Mycobacteriales bacterium]